MINKINYKYWYIFAFIIASILMILYRYPVELDIIRYYERAESDAQSYASLLEYIDRVSQSRVDFIYYGFLFICVKLGIPLGVATTFVLFTYFVLLIRISTMCISGRGVNILILSILMAVPTVTVISISRNAFADVFFLVGVYNYLKGKKGFAIFFSIVALFCHISVSLYILVFLISIILSKHKFVDKYRVAILLGAIILGIIIPTFINDQILGLGMSYLEGTHYASYESLNDTAVLKASYISNGDKLYFSYTFIMLMFLTLKDKNRDAMYWVMYIMCFLYAFYFNSSVQMSLRLSMLSPVFIGYSLNSMYEHKTINLTTLQIISYGMLLIIAVYYYSVRSIYM